MRLMKNLVFIAGILFATAVMGASHEAVGKHGVPDALLDPAANQTQMPEPSTSAQPKEGISANPAENDLGPPAGDEPLEGVKPTVASKPLKVCGEEDENCAKIGSYLLIAYLIFLVVGRYIWVVEPNNQYLRTHADQIDVRLDAEHDPNAKGGDADRNRVKDYLNGVKEKLNRPFVVWLIAFTGRQMSAWRSLHEAERLAIDFYSSSVVRDQAKVILDRLRETQASTTTLEEELRKGLDDPATNLKPLVKEAKAVIYRDEDAQFEALADAQNKALWLVLVAAMILLGLSNIFVQAQVLFLAGAAGGLLSRLRKYVRKRSLPFDYGVSWTVLFLTPLVGALTGWVGTLLFVLLQDWGLVGVMFEGISIEKPTWATLMVALVFGYSATLFEKFVEQLEESLSKK